MSSPGLDQPLKQKRQFVKNVGRYVEVLLHDSTKREGKLIEVTDDGITIETETGKARPAGHRSDGGKKKEIKQETVLFTDIKTTKIQVKF